jgi:hypothetical protein
MLLPEGWYLFIFIAKADLLIQQRSFRVILAVAVVLFLVGVALHFTRAGMNIKSAALVDPLISLGLFRRYRRLFIRRYTREPRDTFLDWTPGMSADRAFNIAFAASAFCLSVLIAYAMVSLARAGW